MTEKQVRDYDKFMLRFPDGMRDAIAERAKANGRSMNSEIIQVLEDALGKSAVSNAPIDDRLLRRPPQILDHENGIAAHLRMLAQLVEEQLGSDDPPRNTPLETLKQNRPSRKINKKK